MGFHRGRAGQTRARPVLMIAAGAAASAIALAGASAANAESTIGLVTGNAYGAKGQLNHDSLPRLQVGPVASQSLPCATFADKTTQNQADESRLGASPSEFLRTGTIVNRGTVDVEPDGSGEEGQFSDVVERSTIQSVSLLAGRIRADVVDVTAHARLDPTHTPRPLLEGSTSFLRLVIDGQERSAAPDPNTRIVLDPDDPADPNDSFIIITLNEQVKMANSTVIRVIGIHVRLFNVAGYRGDVIVGYAKAGVGRSLAVFDGSAYAVKAKAGTLADVGPQNIATIPCGGGFKERIQAGLTIPDLVTTDTLISTVNGEFDATTGAPQLFARSRVEHLSIANGRIVANVITSQSNTRPLPSPPGLGSDDAGTSFLELTIDGNTQSGSVPPNTGISIPDLNAEVTLNSQTCTADGVTFKVTPTRPCTGLFGSRLVVTALVVKFLGPNPDDFPIGTEIRVAEARSGIRI